MPAHKRTAAPTRLAALADGVFAIAITLLTLDIAALVDEHDDTAAILNALPPRLGSYLLGALILGLLWSGHHLALRYTEATDRRHVWLNLNFLVWAALVPFPAKLLGTHYDEALPVVLYAAVLTLAAGSLYAMWAYATRGRRLVGDGLPAATVAALKRRLLVVIGLYWGAAALALWWPAVGIGAFVLSHLWFAGHRIGEGDGGVS